MRIRTKIFFFNLFFFTFLYIRIVGKRFCEGTTKIYVKSCKILSICMYSELWAYSPQLWNDFHSLIWPYLKNFVWFLNKLIVEDLIQNFSNIFKNKMTLVTIFQNMLFRMLSTTKRYEYTIKIKISSTDFFEIFLKYIN